MFRKRYVGDSQKFAEAFPVCIVAYIFGEFCNLLEHFKWKELYNIFVVSLKNHTTNVGM